MSDELRDEAYRAVDKSSHKLLRRSAISRIVVDIEDVAVVAGRLADAKAEADRWQERAEVAEARLATVRADMHLTQMTPDPNDPGAYVLGGDAEAALAVEREGESHE